jgi:predicted transcriptional regulator
MTLEQEDSDHRHDSRDEKVEKAVAALRKGRRLSVVELTKELDCTERTAYRVLEAVEKQGHAVVRTTSNARGGEPVRYFLAS